jgi:hypothetical protein
MDKGHRPVVQEQMTVYVFGAGASFHAGYPFVRNMGSALTGWMKEREGYPPLPFRETVNALEAEFRDLSNIETLLDKIEKRISGCATGYSAFAEVYYPAIKQALREWFAEIHQQDRAAAYKMLAEQVIRPGDCIITFNYDVALDRELKRANLWTLGDGYGFQVEGFESNTPVKILKLHGSVGWLAGMFNGAMSGPFAVASSGVFGHRPILSDADLSALGYENHVDPLFPRNGTAAIHPMVMPTSRKEFYFASSLGVEWQPFWNSLWTDAEQALRRSDKIAIYGYGLFPVDERGCNLLLNGHIAAEVEVCCGSDSERIVHQLQANGRNAHAASETFFEPWAKSQQVR